MDVYEKLGAQNLTLLFKSADNGKSWHYLTDLYPFYWGALFSYRDDIYMLGLTTEYGNLIITRSRDCGNTWEAPVTLFYGSNVLCKSTGGLHRAPMHTVSFNGRLWTSCEYGCWASGSHMPGVISIDENDDLMVAGNWTCTGFLSYEGQWANDGGKQGDSIEGNIVAEADGNIYNYLRWKNGALLKLKVNKNSPEELPEYDGIYKAPASNSMFRLMAYNSTNLLVTNRKTENAEKIAPDEWTYRNVLSLYTTDDFINFKFIKDIVNFENAHAGKIGFQYPAVLPEEDKILIVIRSAFNGAHSSHDSNYILFCTVNAEEITKE